MKRLYRLRKNSDIQRTRHKGRSKVTRNLVLVVLPNQQNRSRFGFAVSKRIGNAVKRNKIKRQLREAARLRQTQVKSGYDILFIARVPINHSSYQQIEQAMDDLLGRLKLIKHSD